MSTIVCGIDDSPAARPVGETAAWLAGALGAQLIAVHVEDGRTLAAGAVLEAFSPPPFRVEPELRFAGGPPAQALMQVAAESEAEFLIVGSRGRRWLASGVLGSVSRTLAREAPCPVVVVPPKVVAPTAWRHAPAASIVTGVDGSGHAQSSVKLAAQLADRLRYRLVVVHALQDVRAAVAYYGAHSATPALSGQPDAVQHEAARIIDEAVEPLRSAAIRVVEPGPPAQVLESVAQREMGVLLVVGARGMGAVRAALLGSVAWTLAVSATRPVVILSEPAELALTNTSDRPGAPALQ